MKNQRRTTKLTPFGLSVKKRLLEIGMSQSELATQIGVCRSYVTDILYGHRAGWKYRDEIETILKMKKSS